MTDRQGTHGHDCWGWGPKHYECAVSQIERLAARLAAPPSAPVGVDFAAVASILRRAMRDGVHYGYRREFILQQALALEALSQQPAAVDGPDAQAAEIEALRAEVERLRRLVQERDTMLGKRLCAGTNADGKPRCLVLEEEHARAEQLAEALRELVDVFSESGMYDEEVFDKARAALGRGE